MDRRTGEIVALKKIFDAFSNSTDAQRTYREVMFLQVGALIDHVTPPTRSRDLSPPDPQAFSCHQNVVQLLNVVTAANNADLYLVFEFMDSDLHAVIKNKLLQPVHHQYIMYQVGGAY